MTRLRIQDLAIVCLLAAGCGGSIDADEDAADDTSRPDTVSDGVVDPGADPPVDGGPDAPVDTADGGPDTAEDPGVDVPDSCILVIVEAESFELNEWWAECPGTGCEDDRSVDASGGGHIITIEDHYTGGPEGYVNTEVTLPRTGMWHIWARSVRGGPGRTWDFALDGTVCTVSIGSAEPVWEYGGEFDVTRTSPLLVIRDAAPDVYWAYPDAFVFAVDPDFDPNLCAIGGVDLSGCLCD